MCHKTVEDDKESKIKDGRVDLVEVGGKTVEIVELKMGKEAELSLEQRDSGVQEPMEVEIVTRTATSASESSMSIDLPCSDPPASKQSIFEPLPMSLEPSSKDTPLNLPVAMSVSPQVESTDHTDAIDMQSDEEEVSKDVEKVFLDEPQKNRTGEKPRQGLRVLFPKGEKELDSGEDDLGSTVVESNKGGQDQQEDAIFKSPMRPAIPSSPARTATNFAALESPSGPHSLGNLSPASLPSPGYTPRSI